MERITTANGNEYYILYSGPGRQEIILCEKWDCPIMNARDKRSLNCTREELLPLMNRLGF